MKPCKEFLCTLFLIFWFSGIVSASPFSDLFDFGASGTHMGETYLEISYNNSNNFVGAYTHSVPFDPVTESINSAFLDITFAEANDRKKNGDPKEVWIIGRCRSHKKENEKIETHNNCKQSSCVSTASEKPIGAQDGSTNSGINTRVEKRVVS